MPGNLSEISDVSGSLCELNGVPVHYIQVHSARLIRLNVIGSLGDIKPPSQAVSLAAACRVLRLAPRLRAATSFGIFWCAAFASLSSLCSATGSAEEYLGDQTLRRNFDFPLSIIAAQILSLIFLGTSPISSSPLFLCFSADLSFIVLISVLFAGDLCGPLAGPSKCCSGDDVFASVFECGGAVETSAVAVCHGGFDHVGRSLVAVSSASLSSLP